MPGLSIAVFSDVICPWCYLGKRRLERALDAVGLRADTRIAWLPFELNPDMPEGGMARADYRANKFGAERSAGLDAEMTARGRDEGVAFAFDRQPRTPNTRLAHMLIASAAAAGVADALVQSLFRAYFEEGLDVGSPKVLAEIAERAGMGREAALAALQDEGLRETVRELERRAAQLGVTGVPFFIVNDAWAISGAQTAEHWSEALRDILSRGDAGRNQPAA